MILSVIPKYLDNNKADLKTVSSEADASGAVDGAKALLDAVELLGVEHSERMATEQYIARKFEEVHQAHIHHFLPYLIRVSQSAQPVAAIGIQPGHHGEMFLEKYLSNPVEQQIAALKKQPVSRDRIVEIGNLVVSHKPAGFMLFLIIASALSRAGFKWMTFTATPVVEKMIQRLGYSPFHLAEANAACLGKEASEWGQYYAKHPRVMVGNLEDAQMHIEHCSLLNKAVQPFKQDIRRLAAEISRQLIKA